jgi:hypothetical protein
MITRRRVLRGVMAGAAVGVLGLFARPAATVAEAPAPGGIRSVSRLQRAACSAKAQKWDFGDFQSAESHFFNLLKISNLFKFFAAPERKLFQYCTSRRIYTPLLPAPAVHHPETLWGEAFSSSLTSRRPESGTATRPSTISCGETLRP